MTRLVFIQDGTVSLVIIAVKEVVVLGQISHADPLQAGALAKLLRQCGFPNPWCSCRKKVKYKEKMLLILR